MRVRVTVARQSQTATKHRVLCCGCVGLLFLAIGSFSLLKRIQASESILPNHQVSDRPTKTHPKLDASYGKLPLGFEVNRGQVSGPVQFLSRGRGYALLLTSDEVILNLEQSSVVSGQSSARGNSRSPVASTRMAEMSKAEHRIIGDGPRTMDSILRMKLVGANASAAAIGTEELPGKTNYLIGNDRKKWRTNVPNYAKVRYQNVYPGVDLLYYGTQGGQLEYDFLVAPGSDAHSIRLSFLGARDVRVDAGTGDLVLALDGREVRFRKPVVYQPTSGSGLPTDRHAIDGGFVLAGRNQIGFQVGAYDHRIPLIVDPVLVYSSYLGGGKFNFGTRVAVDASGSAYLTGTTDSNDFPTTTGVFSPVMHSGSTCTFNSKTFPCPDVFVTKLDPTGMRVVYSTYLGGSQADGATGISVDGSGNAYVTGTTGSADFPTTAGAFQRTASAGRAHAFAAKLDATGAALIYSTYLAGSGDEGILSSALDSSGNLYVGGVTVSPDFPTTHGAFSQTLAPGSCLHHVFPKACADGFIAKLNATGSALIFSTYLGGSNEDGVFGLAVDAAGNSYATGVTLSTDFPTADCLVSLSWHSNLRPRTDSTTLLPRFHNQAQFCRYSTRLFHILGGEWRHLRVWYSRRWRRSGLCDRSNGFKSISHHRRCGATELCRRHLRNGPSHF